ncbi:GNAT family N-acetyltransferase [Azomonas macrocytogenes]|uniref:GNAT superfamily N-acetyltransferase n=1 Tax=Azomonas macrocytogenes TaxID=69962 RepID=A0A839T501_AZOMA|nr:GNAT family N-acetyltransferase [Azomonas macrocytogenes]MBB3102783.1 GNAT superfamily N-acetyltransferase [Azomonas macrocytogenes]
MQIHSATPADIPELVVLLGHLFAQEAEFQPDIDAQTRGLTRIVEDARVGTILLARQQDKVIGMVNLLYTISTALGEPVALLEDMVVAPDARGVGAGSQLLQAAIAHAREKGCKRITLLTDTTNAAAQRFYARHGFEPSSMLPMRCQL